MDEGSNEVSIVSDWEGMSVGRGKEAPRPVLLRGIAKFYHMAEI